MTAYFVQVPKLIVRVRFCQPLHRHQIQAVL